MKLGYSDVTRRTCSECGKVFEIITPVSDYKYRVCQSNQSDKFQCGYTCYDHALLRKEKKRYSLTQLARLVKRNEDSMRAQGKVVLKPISIVSDKDVK